MENDFKTAVEQTSDIANAYKSGIQAIKGSERAKFSFSDNRLIKGSVDIDSVLKIFVLACHSGRCYQGFEKEKRTFHKGHQGVL